MLDAEDLGPGYEVTKEAADPGEEFQAPWFPPNGLQQVSWRLLESIPGRAATDVAQWLSVYMTAEDAKAAFSQVAESVVLGGAYDLEESELDVGDQATFAVFWQNFITIERFTMVVVRTGNIVHKVQIMSKSDTVLKSTVLRWMQTAQEKLAAKKP